MSGLVFHVDNERDQRTQFTASDAMICKHSAVLNGYYKDDLVSSFINIDLSKSGGRSSQPKKPPIINRGYYARVHSINQIIQHFLNAADKTTSKRRQIINLGSGFDTLSLQLLQRNDEGLHIFEIDFDKIVREKVATCLNDDHIRRLLIPENGTEHWNLPRDGTNHKKAVAIACAANDTMDKENSKFSFGNIHFISGDLREAKKIIEKLLKAGIDATAPTLIITECVLVYLEKDESERLSVELSSLLSEAAWVTYDMISPNDIFGKTMIKNLTAARFRVPGFVDYPSLETQIGRFLGTGWCEARCISMLTVYDNYISIEERKRISRLEIFDEVEEWQMLMNHYSLTVAIKGTALLSVLPEPISPTTSKVIIPLLPPSIVPNKH